MSRRSNPVPPLVVSVVMALVAGCAGEADEVLPTRTLAEVIRQTQADAKIVSDAAGTELFNWSTNPTPCTGPDGDFADDDRWYLNAGGNLAVAAADQLATLRRVKEALAAKDYEITDDSVFAGGTRGVLDAWDPATGHNLSLVTTMDLKYVAVSISGPCVMPAPGENPLRG